MINHPVVEMTEKEVASRTSEIHALLREHHPESRGLLDELKDLDGMRCIYAERAAVRRQGLVIMGAINGELVAEPGCNPGWQGDNPMPD